MCRLPRCACAMLGIGAAVFLQACSRDEPEPAANGVEVVSGPARATDARTPAVTRADGSVAVAETRYEHRLSYVIPREAAAIIPLRSLLLADAEAKKARAVLGFRESFAELPPGVSATPWGHSQQWRTAGETAQLLVLVSEGWMSRGGARRNAVVEALIWDKRAGRRVGLGEVFADEERALAAIRGPFCDAHRAARGGRCPGLEGATIAPMRVVEGRFVAVGVWGSGSQLGEGTYAVEFPVPTRLAALVDPRWRGSFQK